MRAIAMAAALMCMATVAVILDDLSSLTGITLKAGYNDEDWQVRDRRMNIFTKDIPVANLYLLATSATKSDKSCARFRQARIRT